MIHFLQWLRSFSFMHTLRGRLTSFYIVSTLCAFALLAFLFSVVFFVTLHNQIDHHIHVVINEAKQIVETYRGEERDRLLKNLVSTQGMTVVLLSPDGSPVLQTNSPDISIVTEHQMQKLMIAGERGNPQPVHFRVGDMTFASVTVRESPGEGVLGVGYSTAVIEKTFRSIVVLILGVMFATLVILAVIGSQLVKRALNPLEQIAQTVQHITSSRGLSLRVDETHLTKELETIVMSMNTMLGRLQRVFTKEHEFFSDAAHTLKTPLAVLRSHIERELPETSTRRQPLIETIDAMVRTINDLLLISRIETQGDMKLQRVNTSNIMEELAELAETLGAEKRLNIQKNIQKNIVLLADPHMMRRALGNVVHNAVTHSKIGGTITLSTFRAQNNHRVDMRIEDTGVGIAKRDLPRVFNRFYRGTGVITKGSGLGLAMTKAIVEHMSGTVALWSKRGKGTRVTVSFHSLS